MRSHLLNHPTLPPNNPAVVAALRALDIAQRKYDIEVLQRHIVVETEESAPNHLEGDKMTEAEVERSEARRWAMRVVLAGLERDLNRLESGSSSRYDDGGSTDGSTTSDEELDVTSVRSKEQSPRKLWEQRRLPQHQQESRSSLYQIIQTISKILRTTQGMLFASLLLTGLASHITSRYARRLMDFDFWDSDKRAVANTYYDRTCNYRDITSQNPPDLLVQPSWSTKQTVESVMTHGAGLFRNVFTAETAAKVRDYVLKKNAEMDEKEMIYIQEAANRWTFAFGANEDEALPQALNEVASHPQLRPAIEELLGPNPAVVELYTITSSYGAETQNFHPDVKSSGSSMMYARSFVPQYTLFIPLQDTVNEMGATGLCPGTHHCSSYEEVDGEPMCDVHGFKVFSDYIRANNVTETVEVDGEEFKRGVVWKAGTGILMNHNTMHRGGGHVLEGGPNRAVVVITFTIRPRVDDGSDKLVLPVTAPGTNSALGAPFTEKGYETRMLSQGFTYTTRFDMAGHTVLDLGNAPSDMANPLAFFQSFGLLKLAHKMWGWDYMTVLMARIANEEYDYRVENLKEELEKLEKKKFGQFLMKHFLADFPDEVDGRGRWDVWWELTLEKALACLVWWNTWLLGLYFVFSALLASLSSTKVSGKSRGSLHRSFNSLLVQSAILSIPIIVMYAIIINSKTSRNIEAGMLTRNPFPDLEVDPSQDLFTEPRVSLIPTQLLGPTTEPMRTDVLIGTRTDATYLKMTNQFLDYHHGNKLWRSLVDVHASCYHQYGSNGPFQEEIISRILTTVWEDNGGRFLYQDPATGDWTVLSEDEAVKYTRRALLSRTDSVLQRLDQVVAYAVSYLRFDSPIRGSVLARMGVNSMDSWRIVLFEEEGKASVPDRVPFVKAKANEKRSFTRQRVYAPTMTAAKLFRPTTTNASAHLSAVLSRKGLAPISPAARFPSIHPPKPAALTIHFDGFIEGDRVEGNFYDTGKWHTGTIRSIATDPQTNVSSYKVEYEDGDFETISNLSLMRHYVPFISGDVVDAKHGDDDMDWVECVVTRVRVHLNRVDVKCVDGKKMERLRPSRIRRSA